MKRTKSILVSVCANEGCQSRVPACPSSPPPESERCSRAPPRTKQRGAQDRGRHGARPTPGRRRPCRPATIRDRGSIPLAPPSPACLAVKSSARVAVVYPTACPLLHSAFLGGEGIRRRKRCKKVVRGKDARESRNLATRAGGIPHSPGCDGSSCHTPARLRKVTLLALAVSPKPRRRVRKVIAVRCGFRLGHLSTARSETGLCSDEAAPHRLVQRLRKRSVHPLSPYIRRLPLATS